MREFYLAIIVTLLLSLSPVWANTSSGQITMEFDLSNHGNKEIAELWIPYPVSNQYQTIDNISIQGNMSSSGVYTDNTFETPILYARWDTEIEKRTLTFVFNVMRKEVIRRDFPAAETTWDPKDYTRYLSETSLGPIDGEIKALADTIVKGQDTILGKARAIYDWTCENTYRNPDVRGCGVGDVYRLLKDPGGKCADISSIFVALARAAGVPSREIFGIRQGKKAVQDISKWQHCWAEFYLPGYGWVPVDPADVRKLMFKEGLEFSNAKTDAYKEYYWGAIDPYRLKLSNGRDLVLNPTQKGEPVNFLMYPYAQVGEEILDWLDPDSFTYTFTYKRL
ncbi:transglutaminase domain-containing protein [Desulfobacterales bacterium HSG17]|nr:transglutaminase domain-containing protein [Desulfobacterales bacterium HSG17]